MTCIFVEKVTGSRVFCLTQVAPFDAAFMFPFRRSKKSLRAQNGCNNWTTQGCFTHVYVYYRCPTEPARGLLLLFACLFCLEKEWKIERESKKNREWKERRKMEEERMRRKKEWGRKRDKSGSEEGRTKKKKGNGAKVRAVCILPSFHPSLHSSLPWHASLAVMCTCVRACARVCDSLHWSPCHPDHITAPLRLDLHF